MSRHGRSRHRSNPQVSTRSARVGELIRRIVAEELEKIDDDRLVMASITGVVVDRDLFRAVVYFTTLDADDDPNAMEALEEYAKRLRREVGSQTRLRRAPELQFRPDETLRAAARIEELLRGPVDGEPPT